MTIEKKLEVFFASELLLPRLREVTSLDFETLAKCLEAKALNEKIYNRIRCITPCYKINGKVYHLGETSDEIYNNDLELNFKLYELYDMTSEMSTGISDTFHVTNLKHFAEASVKEIAEVYIYLFDLK